jgi:hypothetical protein
MGRTFSAFARSVQKTREWLGELGVDEDGASQLPAPIRDMVTAA